MGECDKLLSTFTLGVGLAPLALAANAPCALSRTLELRNSHCLIELGAGAKDLPDELGGRSVVKE